MKITKEQNKLFTKIAKEKLDIDTLEPRNWDRLDFHECGVMGLKGSFTAIWDYQQKRINRLKKKLKNNS